MALGTPANEVQGTLSASFTRGTDTNIVLNSGEGANFPNSSQVVRLTDGDHWCLLKYSSVSTDTLVMASATDYALENNVSSGDETYTWPAGSAVELIMTADYLKELQEKGFTDLADTPSSYAGYAGYSPIVQDDEASLDWQSFADMELESRTIYVDADGGSDATGDGSASTPVQTYAKALSMVRNVIADGVTITIHLKAASAAYTPSSTGRFCIGSGKLVVEGELSSIGSGTATGGSATTIQDTSKSWTTDAYKGKLVKITMGGTDYYRLILSNTADTLTVIGRLAVTPSSGDTYTIYDWGTKIDGSISWYFTQGSISLYDLASNTVSCTFLRPTGYVSLDLNRCSFVASGNNMMLYYSGVSSVSIDTVDFNGNTHNYRAVFMLIPGAILSMYRSWVHGFTYSNILWLESNGGRAVIRGGTIIDGDGGNDHCIYVSGGCFLKTYVSTINGDRDKITIKNATTYGLYVTEGGGALYTGSTYVNYSGNGTADRGADSNTYGFYSD